MLKKYFAVISIAGLFLLSLTAKSYSADNMALMRCLIQQDKGRIIECMEENFPNFCKSEDEEACAAENLSGAAQEKCEKEKAEWFDGLLKTWEALYSQCPQGMSAADCINKIDINSCLDIEDISDTGDFTKSACYALAAFLKNDDSICTNQFYSDNKQDCSYWLENLTLDCPGCADSIAMGKKRYFNWAHDDTSVTMEDASYCEKMSDTAKKDACFARAALMLEDASLCDKISDPRKRDLCR